MLQRTWPQTSVNARFQRVEGYATLSQVQHQLGPHCFEHMVGLIPVTL